MPMDGKHVRPIELGIILHACLRPMDRKHVRPIELGLILQACLRHMDGNIGFFLNKASYYYYF